MECKRLLTHALGLWRKRGSDPKVAQVLRLLSDVTQQLGFCKEGIEQVREAIGINERLGDTTMQAMCLIKLTFMLHQDGQLDPAEEAASRAINLIPEKGHEFRLCELHRALGGICRSKGEIEKAISHFKTALEIATPFNWNSILFWNHTSLVALFRDNSRLEDAQAHIERAKLYTINSPYTLAYATWMQAVIWYKQKRLEEARSEALRAVNAFEKLGAVSDVEVCRELFQNIQKKLDIPVLSG